MPEDFIVLDGIYRPYSVLWEESEKYREPEKQRAYLIQKQKNSMAITLFVRHVMKEVPDGEIPDLLHLLWAFGNQYNGIFAFDGTDENHHPDPRLKKVSDWRVRRPLEAMTEFEKNKAYYLWVSGRETLSWLGLTTERDFWEVFHEQVLTFAIRIFPALRANPSWERAVLISADLLGLGLAAVGIHQTFGLDWISGLLCAPIIFWMAEKWTYLIFEKKSPGDSQLEAIRKVIQASLKGTFDAPWKKIISNRKPDRERKLRWRLLHMGASA